MDNEIRDAQDVSDDEDLGKISSVDLQVRMFANEYQMRPKSALQMMTITL